jgi:hypothetical protein
MFHSVVGPFAVMGDLLRIVQAAEATVGLFAINVRRS